MKIYLSVHPSIHPSIQLSNHPSMYLPKRKWLSQWWKSRLLRGIEGGFSLLTKHGFKCLVNYKLKIKVDMQMSFYYYNLPGVSVRNPARDKVMRKEAWQNARTWSDFRGSPLNFLSIHPPKTRVCLLYCVMLSTYSSVINRGLSPHHLFLEIIRAFR